MSDNSVGDVQVTIGLSEEDLNKGLVRVNSALTDVTKMVEKMGAQIDAAMSLATAAVMRTTTATQQYSEAQKYATEYTKQQQKATEGAAGALDGFRERLAAISSERTRAFAGMGDQLMGLQKQLTTAQVGGDAAGAAQAKQQIIAIQQDIVRAQKDALAVMSQDRKLSDDQYMTVKQAQQKAEQELRNLDVANHRAAEEQKLAITRQAEQQKTEAAKQAAQVAAEAAKQQQQDLQNLKQGLTQIGVAAAAMSYAIEKAVQSFGDAYKQQQRNFESLDAIASAYGQSAGQAKDAARALTADGILPMSSAVAAMRDLITSGLNVDQATRILEVFKDRAALGRAETVSFSKAVENLGQAFKTEQSRLGDMSGMTENFSRIIEVGAAQMGKQVSQLTDAERAQAKYLGILQLSIGYAGGMAKMTDTLAASEDRAANSALQARVAFGEDLAPALQMAYNASVSLLQSVTAWAQHNPELARGLFLVVGGAVALTAAAALLTVGVLNLNRALASSPIGLTIVLISAFVGAIGGAILAGQAAAAAQLKHAQSVADLSKQYENLQRTLTSTSATQDDKTKATEDQKRVIKELGDLMPEIVTKWDLEGNAIEINTQKLKANTDAARENVRAKAEKDSEQAFGDEKTAREALQRHVSGRDAFAETATRNLREVFLRGHRGEPSQKDIDEIIGAALKEYDQQTSGLERDLAVKQGKLARLLSMQGKMSGDFNVDSLPPPPGSTPPGSTAPPPKTGSGSGKSDALQNALQDIQDLKAKGPEALEALQTKVKEVLGTFGTELEAFISDKRGLERELESLPGTIKSRDFTEAMKALDFSSQMEDWAKTAPQKMAEGLQGIQTQFAAWLAKPENKELAQGLELKLKAAQQGLSDADKAKLRAQLQEAQDIIANHKQLDPDNYSPTQEAADIKATVPLMVQLGDMNGAIAAIAAANDLLKKASDQAFQKRIGALPTGAANIPADLQRQMIDAQAAGDQATEAKLTAQIHRITQDALQTRRDALQQLVADQTLSADQRAEAEKQLADTEKALAGEALNAYRDAQQAKTRAAQEHLQQMRTIIQQLEAADLESIQKRQKAAEDAQQAKITGLQEQLRLLEQSWQVQDQQDKLAQDRANLAQAQANGPLTQRIRVDGTAEWVNQGAIDAQKKLAEDQRQADRQNQRNRLEDQIRSAQEQLQNMQRYNQQVLVDRRTMWETLLTDDNLKGLAMATAADTNWGNWAKAIATHLATADTAAKTTAASIQTQVDNINKALAALSQTTIPQIPLPTLPTPGSGAFGGKGGTTIQVGSIPITLPGVTDAAGFAKALPGALQSAGIDVAKLKLGWNQA